LYFDQTFNNNKKSQQGASPSHFIKKIESGRKT
jgi:hypothetical protein